jgi:hypothetical protein
MDYDEAMIHLLMAQAGFKEVTIEPVTKTGYYENLDGFLWLCRRFAPGRIFAEA